MNGWAMHLPTLISGVSFETASEEILPKIKEYNEAIEMFKLYEFPVTCKGVLAEDVIKASKNDKKADAGKIKFILLDSIGDAIIDKTVSDDEMRQALKRVLE